MQPKHLVI